MKDLKKKNPNVAFVIVMWAIPNNYLTTALKPIEKADVSLFESKEVWAVHKAKKYTTIVYDKLGYPTYRYTHKGGPLFTNAWQDNIQKALDEIK